ncbi:MAG: hypothetical protein FWE98_06925 [Oscillospiraceae bacterium]|nr:hypothetical protein [Oscillospiraceae bacterium]
MKSIKMAAYYLLQWTWALSQNLVGGIAYLLLRGKYRHERFHGAVVTYVDKKGFGGVSIGMFIFMSDGKNGGWAHDTRIHELGHCVQSILLGPLYWVVVGLPSFTWCNLPPIVRWRKEKDVSYYALYCEGWANIWGAAWSGEDFVTEEMKKRGRYGRAWVKR